MTDILFSADSHFHHDNISKFCNRPYKTVEEMNEDLIKNWNLMVRPGDLVYHLGDFSWKDPVDILPRLNGQIFLIKGSHDRWIKGGIPKKIVKVEELYNFRIEDRPITLCHYALKVWHLSHYDSWNLYGHSHGKLDPVGKQLDVGVDNIYKLYGAYRPISWYEIKAYMSAAPHNFNYIKNGSF